MSLSDIITGKVTKPPRIVIYGTEGIGKTTFAAKAKSAILIPTEDGADEVDVAKFPKIKSYDGLMKAVQDLANEKHTYKTVILDTWDALEMMAVEEICEKYKTNNINQAAGGYGAGKNILISMMNDVVTALQYLREEKGMTIIVVAHSTVKTVSDPQYGSYDQFTLKATHPDVTGVLVSWADVVLFANHRMRLDEESGLAKAIGNEAGGQRVIYTVRTPAYIAKNRYDLPPELPLDWQTFGKEIGKRMGG